MKHLFLNAKEFGRSVRKAVYLYKNIWKERTTILLHAPREVNKTDRALDIAIDIASNGRKVLYVNVDNNLDAYSDVVSECDNIVVFNPEFETPEDRTDYADLVFEAIEQAVATTSIRTFVIDSVSRIAALSFGRNASAAYIMKRLVAMQIKCKISILAVAHDMNRSTGRAIVALADSELDVTPEKPVVVKGKAAPLPPVAEILPENRNEQSPETALLPECKHAAVAETNLLPETQPVVMSGLLYDASIADRKQQSLSTRLSIACRRNASKRQKRRKR